MFVSLNRLGSKLLLTTLVFVLVLATATAILVTRGFRSTQDDATQRSKEGLESQGRESLLALTKREAEISAAQLQRAISAGQQAAQYFVAMARLGGDVPSTPVEQLARGSGGQYFDTNPDRISDLVMFSGMTLDTALERDIRQSAALDAFFPAVLQNYPDAVAIYYINPAGLTRYYPAIGLADVIPPDFAVTQEPFFALAAPEANPGRQTVWTPPYMDPAGQGAMVTASTPIYDGDEFRGVIGIDVLLTSMIEQLGRLKPTENSYAFLVDQNGRLVAAPSVALQQIFGEGAIQSPLLTDTLGMDLNTSPNATFRTILQAMRGGQSGVERLDLAGDEVFLAYAPLTNMGWSLGLVAPIAEVTAQSAAVASAIKAGTDDTVRTTLIAMAAFFLLALVGTVVLGRRLTRPIAALVAGTRAVAAGDLSVTIPITSGDELGLLAQSFNQMTNEIAAARERLESWTQNLERTVEQRTAELAQAKEEAERARAIAEQANQLKSQFLANMSHELRTPLNSIINFSRIISAGIHGPVTDEQKEYLDRVRRNGEHLLGLINDILDLSKIETGRMDLYKEPLRVEEVIKSILGTAERLTKGKLIELRQEIEPNLPVVQADRARIRQVLLNLLSNAAKFTETGSITVRASLVDDDLVISVVDTGIGIPPEHLPLVFEEFRQVDGSTNRRYEGTGVGLAICKKLIDLHNGRIWVESTPGAGSSFSFSLPLAPGETTLDKPEIWSINKTSGDASGPAILVIDDDQEAIEIISTYLRYDGYKVYGLTDSRWALNEARRLKPAAIILDILMPHKDGWEVLADIRSDPELGMVPVALYSILDERRLGFYLGATAYLTKPIEEDQLRSTIAHLVGYGAKILIIDDDEDVREVVSQQIRQAGIFTTITAGGGREALERIAQDPPDLIILDLMMPEVDGFAVLEELDREPTFRPIPVIVLTAKDLSREEREFLNRRVNGLMIKGSTSPEELLDKIRGLLRPLRDDAEMLVDGKGGS